MILGVGVDLVEISRCTALWQRYGGAFARRILGAEEQAELTRWQVGISNPDNARIGAFFAKHFSAKEALGKALGLGLASPANLHATALRHAPGGQPRLEFAPPLAFYMRSLAREAGFSNVLAHISLSDEAGLVSAHVVLEYV